MSGAVQSETIRCVGHSVNRFMFEMATTPQEFRARYERAVPLVPLAEVRSLADARTTGLSSTSAPCACLTSCS